MADAPEPLDTTEGWTKGPWEVVHNSWETSTVYSHDMQGVVAVCPIDSGVDELTQDHLERVKEANAHAIAALPALYDVARLTTLYDDLLRKYQGPLSTLCGGDVAEIDDAYDRLIAAARAALALARGEQS